MDRGRDAFIEIGRNPSRDELTWET